MLARYGEKIRDAGHTPVPGLLPILREIQEWDEVSSGAVASETRGKGTQGAEGGQARRTGHRIGPRAS